MSGARVLIETGPKRSLVSGRAEDVLPALRDLRMQRNWDAVKAGWYVPSNRLDDLLSELRHRFGGDSVQLVVE